MSTEKDMGSGVKSRGVGKGRAPGSKATQFKAGEPNPCGVAQPRPKLTNEVVDTLTAMRHVVSNRLDVTEQHASLRQWKKEAPGAFFQEYRKLEGEEREEKKARERKREERDEGVERCRELVRGILARHQKGVG